MINSRPLYIANHPVGLESRVHKVKSLLDVESNNGVHMVGIYGIGGIGKTTLASAVYNSISDHFEGLSFLSDIRETTLNHGLLHLQETLLSDILGEKDIKLGNVRKGIPIIKSRLCKKKILLILDDVDNKEQLEKLAGGLDWFGSGSRIIITTRDIHLLRAHGVERTYQIEGLNHKEALELFSWNAFKRNEVNPSYLDISERVILRSNGLPLFLEIIGSDLFGKTQLEWESALGTYERIPHENIQEILKVSFDGLKDFEKEIFLDIACFFNGYKLSDVKNVLHISRGLVTDYAIKVLIDKCLIKVEYGSDVRIHNLIENMGREIVRQESPSKPGERSRLWFFKDILHVFKENKGSDKTEIIMLHLPKDKDVKWDGNALKKMENLKILVVQNARFSRGPTALPNSLRVLKWPGYPGSSLPADFNPKKLVILDLSQELFTFSNQLNMKFKSLTEMNLSGCEIQKVPDMSGAPNLKSLDLDHCDKLVEVHDSVGFLDKLEYLSLKYCTSLKVLPRGMNLTSLKTMSLKFCLSLTIFPEILGKMENLTFLDMRSSAISGLPFSIGNLVGLTILRLRECVGLLELPSSVFMLPKLGKFEASYCKQLAQVRNGEVQDRQTMSSSVSHVKFHCCFLTDNFLATLVPCLRNVTSLSLNHSNITVLPSSITACLSLTELYLNECKKLREISGLPPNVQYLSAINCTSLTFQSKEMLLNQTLHKTGGTHFQFPGSTIPNWMNHSSRGSSLHFLFRNKLPAITLCVVGSFGNSTFCPLNLIINDIQCFQVKTLFVSTLPTLKNHTILTDLLLEFHNIQFEKNYIKNGWNSAEISCVYDREERRVEIEWVGVHVQEQNTNMADIQFESPNFSVAEKQFPNQYTTAGREIPQLRLLSPHAASLNKKRKRNMQP